MENTDAEKTESNNLLPPNPSELESENLDEHGFASMRSAYTANYYENCIQFNKDQSLQNLQSLDRALDKVHPDDIDVEEAEKLVQILRPLLDLSHGREVVLWSCQLVVKFQVSKPDSLWLGSVDTTEKAASSFRDVSFLLLSENQAPPVLAYVIDTWHKLVKMRKLEEHHSYPLLTCGLQWIFSLNSPQDITRSFVSFIAVTYSRLPPAAKDRILQDIITFWLKSPKPGSGTFSTVFCELILGLVAVSGEIPDSIWEEAVALKSRSSLERSARNCHAASASLATVICRRLIDSVWSLPKSSIQRIEFQNFVSALASALISPHWPSAELFVSSLISALFQFSGVIRSPKYLGFMFECFGTLEYALAKVSKRGLPSYDRLSPSPDDPGTPDTEVIPLVCSSIRKCSSNEQAAYFASRQCLLLSQHFFDYYRALSSRCNIGIKGLSGVSEVEWVRILGQYPIATYYSKISQLICDLAFQDDIRESNQVELLRLLDKYVRHDPELFDIRWLDRLSYAVPAVCEALIPLVTAAYNSSHNINLLVKLTSRLNAPGAPQFKKRTLALLSTTLTSSLESNVELGHLAWKASLVSLTDSDTSVQQAAFSLASGCFDQQAGPRVAEAIVTAQKTTDSAIFMSGLEMFLNKLRKTDQRGNAKVQKLVKQLLSLSEFEMALTFIQVDGGFTPYSQIPPLIALASAPSKDSSTSKEYQRKICALTILDCTLKARPRVILPPALTTTMFSTFIKDLKTASTGLIGSIGSILGQLVYLAHPQVQRQRLATLSRVSAATLASARKHEQQKDALIFRQSMLVSSCIRYWTSELESVQEFTDQCLQWLSQPSSEGARLLLIRVLFEVAVEHRALFSDARIDSLFKSFEHGSPEATLFTQLLLKHMSKHQTNSSSKLCSISALPSTRACDEEQSASLRSANAMLQGHLARLVTLARENEELTVLRVVAKAIEENLLAADECIPVITSLCFSTQQNISQTALRSFVTLCERWPRNVGVKFVEGLKLVQLRSELSASIKLSSIPLRITWDILKQSSKNHNIETMLDQLAKLLNHQTSQVFLIQLLDGLTRIDMHFRDAKHLARKAEDEVNRFDPELHGQQNIAKTAMCYMLVLWMRRRYGLSEHARLAGRNPRKPDEELEPIDFQALLRTFSSKNDADSRSLLNELWSLPDWYGTHKMNRLVYEEEQEHVDTRILPAKRSKI